MLQPVVSSAEGSGTCLLHRAHVVQKPQKRLQRWPASCMIKRSKVYGGKDHTKMGSCRGQPSIRCQAMAEASLLLPKGIRKGVEILEKDGVHCLIAKEDIAAGEEILRVPQEFWITPEMACGSEMGSLIANLEPWLQLALFLIQEWAKIESDQGSKLEAYISTLPKTLGSPAFWSEDALESIKGSQLWESSEGYREFIAQRYMEIKESLFAGNEDIFKPEIFTFETFCWSVGNVRSRTHPPLENDQAALVPVADLVTHSRKPNAAWSLSSGNLLRRGSCLLVSLTQDVASGDSIQMDYGKESLDAKIALNYGVVDKQIPMGGYFLQLEIPDTDPNLDDKLDILELESGASTGFCCDLIAQQNPPPELLAFLRLLNCSGEDAFHLEAIFRNDAWDHMMEPLSETNETMICETMINGCTEALEPYKSISSLEPSTSPIQTMGRKICMEEQEALEWTLQWFVQRKGEVKLLEYYAEKRLKSLNLLDEDGNTTFEDMITGK